VDTTGEFSSFYLTPTLEEIFAEKINESVGSSTEKKINTSIRRSVSNGNAKNGPFEVSLIMQFFVSFIK